jgi:hypothetical protein
MSVPQCIYLSIYTSAHAGMAVVKTLSTRERVNQYISKLRAIPRNSPWSSPPGPASLARSHCAGSDSGPSVARASASFQNSVGAAGLADASGLATAATTSSGSHDSRGGAVPAPPTGAAVCS